MKPIEIALLNQNGEKMATATSFREENCICVQARFVCEVEIPGFDVELGEYRVTAGLRGSYGNFLTWFRKEVYGTVEVVQAKGVGVDSDEKKALMEMFDLMGGRQWLRKDRWGRV